MKAGDRLAHYEITGPIGSGGMGEVFGARDTRLDREVAIKVLPEDFAADPERLARFRREAKLLAALNHTNIAAIHGLEEEDGRLCLAMELAAGATLAASVERGPMPVEDVLKVGVQIAAGLEEAHEKGIVHRDLKPANVKLTPDGQVKILDFGLARAYLGDEAGSADSENSPTLTAAMTGAGVILGTAAYMSPEQARGHGVDSRTDVWAFGVLLYELLVGKRLFHGGTVSDTLAMVLRSEPDWDALPADVPPSLRRLLRRCLQRDRKQRLHHIADARIVLEEILQDGTSAHEAVAADLATAGNRGGRAGWLGWAVLAVFVAAVLGRQAFNGTPSPAPRPTVRMTLELPEGHWVSSQRKMLAVAPAGDALVVAMESPRGDLLFQRDLDDPTLHPIEGTEGASNPFFSPDGRWIAFTQAGRLRKVDRDGGSPVDLCKTEWGGGVWTTDGRIIITRSYAGGLDLLPAGGGPLQKLTEPDMSRGELGHWWPQLLPGHQWLIYTSWSTPIDKARIMALSLESGEQRVLVEGGAFGRYAASGHLLYVREGQLMAAPFDVGKLMVTAGAEPVLDDIHLSASDGFSNLDFSSDGTLIYVPASVMAAPRSLVWVERDGTMTPLEAPDRRYFSPRLSPDGSRLSVTIAENQNSDVWLHEFARGTWSRFTFTPASDFNAIWTPDGRTVIYNGEEPQFTVYGRPADGSADTRLLFREPVDSMPTDVSPDGSMVVMTYSDPETDSDIWLLPLDESGPARPFLATRFSESEGMISPDGRWLAYVSYESGRAEVYAMPFPAGGSRVQISIEGGNEPAWSPQGDELFFRSRTGMMSAPIDAGRTTATDLAVGRPVALFAGFYDSGDWAGRNYDVTRDGQRFLMVNLPEDARPRSLQVVVNWFGELERAD